MYPEGDKKQSESNISFNKLAIDDIRQINRDVIARGDHPLAYRNMARSLDKLFDIALLRWRRGESPVSDMEMALDAAAEMLRAISEWRIDDETLIGKGDVWSLVRYIPYFLDRQLILPETLLDLVRRDRSQCAGVALDDAILDAIEGRDWHHGIEELLQRLGTKKRQMLAVETYRVYFALLQTNGKAGAADDLVRAGEANYNRRARDAFYDGGTTYMGGGPDNPYVVDFVLAAILKHIGWSGQSIYRWVWLP